MCNGFALQPQHAAAVRATLALNLEAGKPAHAKASGGGPDGRARPSRGPGGQINLIEMSAPAARDLIRSVRDCYAIEGDEC